MDRYFLVQAPNWVGTRVLLRLWTNSTVIGTFFTFFFFFFFFYFFFMIFNFLKSLRYPSLDTLEKIVKHLSFNIITKALSLSPSHKPSSTCCS